jgi:hypothetical protein
MMESTMVTERREPVLAGARGAAGWIDAALEVIVSLGAAAAFAYKSANIRVDPLVRIGQVSGLASLGFRFAVCALGLIAMLIIADRVRGGVHVERTWRLVCAAMAGLSAGMVAGGVLVALHGTRYGLGGEIGDAGILAAWAENVRAGGHAPTLYPPLQIYPIAWLADLLGTDALHAMKAFQVIGVGLVGPLAYLSWRLLLSPGWALGIGVVAAIPLFEPYREYPFLSLIAFVPLAIRFLQVLRRADQEPVARVARAGVGFGVGFGLLFLLYSGWYLWSAPGFLVAVAIVFPWRRGWPKGVLLGGLAAVVFVLISWRYLIDVLGAPPLRDAYMYFDSDADPAYIAMWRGGLPGAITIWPPLGELGGVGVFTLLLVLGLGVAVALGRARTLVIGVTALMTSAWLIRFWRAHLMWKTGLVQLYPRTTAQILYCLLILCGFAVYLAVERARRRAPEDSPLRTTAGPLGALCALSFLFASSGSAIGNFYMPTKDGREHGWLAWMGQALRPGANHTVEATVVTSSSYEAEGWSRDLLIDGTQAGFTSALGNPDEHEEWIELRLPGLRRVSKVVVKPAYEGFPMDLAVEVWSGQEWLPRARRTDPAPPDGPVVFSWQKSDRTDRVRIRATHLRQVGASRAVRLAEIELYP